MIEIGRGAISKMSARLDGPNVQYAFRLDDVEVPVNPMIGTTVRLEYLGDPLHPLRAQDQNQFQSGLLLPVHDQTGAVRPVHHEPGALPL